MEVLSSTTNPKIRGLIALEQKASERKERGLFVVEGVRELGHCIRAGYQIDSLFVCPEIADEEAVNSVLKLISSTAEKLNNTLKHSSNAKNISPDNASKQDEPANPIAAPSPDIAATRSSPTIACKSTNITKTRCEFFPKSDGISYGTSATETISSKPLCRIPKIFYVSKELYAKIAYRSTTEGIIAEVCIKSHSLSDLTLSDRPIVAVIEGVEKPGNVGAILRTCDAMRADALIICDPRCDLYNPNLIRASIGAAFTVPCAICTSEEAINYLRERDFQILTAQLQDSSLYYDCDMKGATAIVMGAEDIGLSNIWREAANSHIRIPMLGELDSLNVSVSCAILLFESLRQRQQ